MLTELFGVKDIDELKRLAVDEMTQHRIVEYVYEYILDGSAIRKSRMLMMRSQRISG